MSDSEAQKTFNELLEAIASNQTTIQEIGDPINLNEMQPMKDSEAAQEIEEVLNNDSIKEKSVDDVDECVKDNVEMCTIQHRGKKRGMIVQDIDTSTNDKAEKIRRKTKTTTRQDKETTRDKSEDVKKSVQGKTKKSTQDKGLNDNLLRQELAVVHHQKSEQNIKDLELESLQENENDNYIEIQVPFKLPQTKELGETKNEVQKPIDKYQQLIAIQTPVQEHREKETSIEIKQPIEKDESPTEDKQAIQLEHDLQTTQDTLIPFDDKHKEEFDTSIEETEEAIQETTQTLKDITETIEETTESVEESAQLIKENVEPIKENVEPIEETTQVKAISLEYTKDTNLKDIPRSVFEKFYTAQTSYIGNKGKGKFLYQLIYVLMLGTGF